MTKNLLLPLLALALTVIAGCGGSDPTPDGGPTGGSDSGPPTGSDSGPRPDGGPTTGDDGGPTTGDDGGPVADGGPTSGDDGGPVADAGLLPVTCAEYCVTIQANCTGDNEQFANPGACNAACDWDLGDRGATTGDTVACRLYHATAAGESEDAAMTHCPHAGETPTAFCM
jgi:hypothetical protein